MSHAIEAAPLKTEAKDGRTPETVLADWVARITEQSGGILQGEVWTRTTEIDLRAYHLDLEAPELDGEGCEIISVYTPPDAPYPATAHAAVFRELGLFGFLEVPTLAAPKQANRADDDAELDALIAHVVESPPVAETLQRLIAEVLEQRKAAPPP